MGKALTLIGMWVFISMICSMFALSIYSIDPNSPLLASNALLGNSSLVRPYVNNYDTYNWTFNNNISTYKPTQSATNVGTTTGTSYPDWINSSLKWISDIFSVLFNIVGAPYTLALWMLGTASSLGAVIGIGLSIINMFILVNWIFGKVD